jgi:hypothetical protein
MRWVELVVAASQEQQIMARRLRGEERAERRKQRGPSSNA